MSSFVTDAADRYYARLKSFISRRVPADEDAEDIVQDVFYQLSRVNSLLMPIEQVAAWLYRVARNSITDWYRKKKEEPLPETGEQEDQKPTQEAAYLQTLVWEELETALEELPAEQRAVFEMTEFDGLSFKEISRTNGVPVNTLLSRKRYAVLHIREKLSGLYADIIDELN